MRITKAVILAAGLGTRLVPYSKEMPKEMLPIFQKENGETVLKPIIQVVFEQLFDAGIREFCFIVGRTKRAIEDHFTPDWDYVDLLLQKNKEFQARMLENFYRKIEESYILWANQSKPKGTGHAIYMARNFVGDDYFVAEASDNLFIGENVPKNLLNLFHKYGKPFLTVKKVDNPSRYGVVVVEPVAENVYRALRIEEKPKEPISNLANTSIYIFPPEIFRAIENTKESPRGEIEITSSIQILIDEGAEFYVYESSATWIDAGTWDTYLMAIFTSLKQSVEPNVVSKYIRILND